MIRDRHAYAFITLCALAAGSGLAGAGVEPFTATYGVEWRGMGAGTSTLELSQADGEIWTYRSRNTARGIFRLAFPQAITQVSVFRIEDGQVVPLSYQADDGSKKTERDVSLQFDWSAHRVKGIAEDEPVDIAVQPGALDPMSVQIALMCELAAGRSPERFWLVDKDELKQYDYVSEGTARLDTVLGPLDTIVYRSQREGSNRVTRLWLAPGLGYLPVRAQQIRRDRVEFTMSLRKVEKA